MPQPDRSGWLKDPLGWLGAGAGAQIVRGAGGYLLLHVAGVVLGLGVHVLMARTMSVESYGIYVVAFSWLTLLLHFARVGLGTAALRFVAVSKGGADWGHLRGFLRLSGSVVLGASLAVGALTAGVVQLLAPRMSAALTATLWLACLAIPLYAFMQLWENTLRGLRGVIVSRLPSLVLQPILMGAIILGLFLAEGELEPTTAMAAGMAGTLAAALLLGGLIRRSLPPGSENSPPQTEARRWMRVAVPLLAINVLNLLLQRADILFLGALEGSSEAGLYGPARRLAGVIGFGVTAVATWAAPQISDLHARGEQEALRRMLRRSAQFILLFTVPAVLVTLVFGRFLLGLFGPEFETAYGVVVVLSVAHLVTALVGPAGFLLMLTGHQDVAAKILVGSVILDLVLLSLLIPALGTLGAAFASAATMIVWNLSLAWTAWRRVGLRATIV